MSLDGKTAVVTGGGRGIGLAYCRRLAADGAHVIAVDLDDPSATVADLPGTGDKLGLACDVSKPDQVSAVAQAVIERYGRCDILVNNAAVFPSSELETITLALWRLVQATNVEAALLFTQAFAPGMTAARWGRIVNSGSANTLLQQRDLAYMTAMQTIKRVSVPDDLANTLGFLVSEDASFITGQIIHVDGGLTRTGA